MPQKFSVRGGNGKRLQFVSTAPAALEGAGLGNGVSHELDAVLGNRVPYGGERDRLGRQRNAGAGFVVGKFPKPGIVKSFRPFLQQDSVSSGDPINLDAPGFCASAGRCSGYEVGGVVLASRTAAFHGAVRAVR